MGNVSSINDAYAWNITRIAEAFGLHRDTVRRRLKENQIKPVRKVKGVDVYALMDVGPALFSAESANKSEDDYDPNKMAPKDRKDFFQSERERLKFQTEIGELMPDSDYRLDLAETLKAVVAWCESLPDNMERTRLFTPEQLDLLESTSDGLRAQLYVKILEVEPNAT
uniref:Terminase small subunit n=1 Tax=Aliivibrio phage vB_Alvi_H905 TaxID=3234039 RepID=A0AB39C9V0_9VIRU